MVIGGDIVIIIDIVILKMIYPRNWVPPVSAINNEQLIINNYPFLKRIGLALLEIFLIYPLERGGFKP